MSELFDHIDEMRRSTGRVAVATLVNTRGTTPRKEGARMVVGEGGAILGSVTIGGCVDAQVIEQAVRSVRWAPAIRVYASPAPSTASRRRCVESWGSR